MQTTRRSASRVAASNLVGRPLPIDITTNRSGLINDAPSPYIASGFDECDKVTTLSKYEAMKNWPACAHLGGRDILLVTHRSEESLAAIPGGNRPEPL